MISAGNFVAFFVGVIAGFATCVIFFGVCSTIIENKNGKAKEAEHEQLDR